jgi:hypothetical protein
MAHEAERADGSASNPVGNARGGAVAATAPIVGDPESRDTVTEPPPDSYAGSPSEFPVARRRGRPKKSEGTPTSTKLPPELIILSAHLPAKHTRILSELRSTFTLASASSGEVTDSDIFRAAIAMKFLPQTKDEFGVRARLSITKGNSPADYEATVAALRSITRFDSFAFLPDDYNANCAKVSVRLNGKWKEYWTRLHTIENPPQPSDLIRDCLEDLHNAVTLAKAGYTVSVVANGINHPFDQVFGLQINTSVSV